MKSRRIKQFVAASVSAVVLVAETLSQVPASAATESGKTASASDAATESGKPASVSAVATESGKPASVSAVATESGKTASASSALDLRKNSRVLYLGGCRGKKEDGTKARFYSFVNVAKFYDGFDEKTMNLLLENTDSEVTYLKQKKHRIYAAGVGETVVMTRITDKETGEELYSAPFYITVKQNADDDSLVVEGIEDGEEYEAGETIQVSLPCSDTDKRSLSCEDDTVMVKQIATKENTYEVTFTESGEFTLVAGAYQSRKYPGNTATRLITVTATCGETEIRQTGLKTLEITGDGVYEDLQAADISVYEVVSGADVFYTNADEVTVNGDTAFLSVFKPLDGNKKYSVNFAGERTDFISVGTSVADVADIAVGPDRAVTGEKTPVTVAYFTKEGIDISEKVKKSLDPLVKLSIEGQGTASSFLQDHDLFMMQKDETITLAAVLELPYDEAGESSPTEISGQQSGAGNTGEQSAYRTLTAHTVVTAVEKEEPSYVGTCIYTFTTEDGRYLTSSDTISHSIVQGDNVVFEALLLYSDGKYRTMKEAGITRAMMADESILMQKGRLFGALGGGIRLTTNDIGDTGIILYKDDEVVESFNVSVLEKRRADRLEVSLSKDKLNTNPVAGDYLIVRADVYDQYGKLFDAGPISITQSETSKKKAGSAVFSSFVNGRLVINGYDCIMTGKSDLITAMVSCGDFSQEISFSARDVIYDGSRAEKFDMKLKQQGPLIMDAALLKTDEEPDNALFSAEITRDGFYVSELAPILLKKLPNISQKPEEFGMKEGESTFGVLIEFTPDKITADSRPGTVVISEETECILCSYMGLELWAYQNGSRLESGTYKITLYYISCGQPYTTVKKCGEGVSLRVVDSDPEIIYDQIAESAEISGSASWASNIKKYFKFYLEGEDITQYVTNVDCSESSTGAVYVKSVDFRIPNRYYGSFEKTAEVDILITKK